MNASHGIFYVLLAAAIGGGIPALGKIGLTVIPPTTFTFFRFVLAALCMIPLILPFPKISGKQLGSIILVSLLATGNVTFFAFGVKQTTATISQLLYTIVPVISLMLSARLYGETITLRKVTGIGTGLVGVVLLILLPMLSKGSASAGTMAGNLTVLGAVISFSFYSVLSKKYQQIVTPPFLTFVFAVTTLSVLSPFAVMEYLSNPAWVTHLTLPAFLAVTYVGIFGGAVYYLVYQLAIKRSGPVIASLTMFIQPLAAYLWALALLGEKLIPGVMAGAVLTIVGASIVNTPKSSNAKIQISNQTQSSKAKKHV